MTAITRKDTRALCGKFGYDIPALYNFYKHDIADVSAMLVALGDLYDRAEDMTRQTDLLFLIRAVETLN